MKKGIVYLLVLAWMLCLAACNPKADEQISWDAKPGIIMNGITYCADSRDVIDVLPEDFVYVGDVTAEIAGHLTDLIDCKMYRSENHAGYYIYQQMEWKDGQWAYVRYIH